MSKTYMLASIRHTHDGPLADPLSTDEGRNADFWVSDDEVRLALGGQAGLADIAVQPDGSAFPSRDVGADRFREAVLESAGRIQASSPAVQTALAEVIRVDARFDTLLQPSDFEEGTFACLLRRALNLVRPLLGIAPRPHPYENERAIAAAGIENWKGQRRTAYSGLLLAIYEYQRNATATAGDRGMIRIAKPPFLPLV